MEQFVARILIQHVKGGTIAYLYNRESFALLKVPKHTEDDSQFLEIGQTIEYEGKKYRIKEINFKLEKQMFDMNHGYGINMYSPTDPSDFNCQVGIFVENT